MKNKNYIYQLIIFTFLSFLFSEMKIGYVHVDKVFSQLDDLQQIQAELEKEQRQMEVEYQNLQFELDSIIRNYEQQKMLMSEDRRKKTENDINTKGAELERFLQSKSGPQGELYQLQERLLGPVYMKIQNAVDLIGREEGYDYIINSSTGLLIYALPQHDITDKVIDTLDKIHETEND